MTSRPNALLRPVAMLIALLVSGTALAQEAGLQITLVRQQDGTPAGNVEFTVRNTATGLVQQLRTDAAGHARLDGLLASGAYEIEVAQYGTHAALRSGPIALRANNVQSVQLLLSPPDLTEVVVTARRDTVLLNARTAEVSAGLGAEQLEALPIEGRDVVASLIRLPNVVPSTGFFPEAPGISINGANSLYTNYLIDGLDNNENFLGGQKFPVPVGFTRDVTVLTNNYSVAYGRTANGIVNYTTPSGSNDSHAEVYVLSRPGRPLDARSAFPRRDLSGNAVGESFERLQTGGSWSGPLQTDRTFLYVNVEYTRDTNRNLVDAPALNTVASVTGHNTFLLSSARIDHRLDDRWSISGRVNVGQVSIDRPGGALGAGNVTFPTAGSDQDRNSVLAAFSTAYAGADWNYDGALQFSRFRWNYGAPKGPPGPQVAIQDNSGLTVGVVGNPGFVFNDLERTWQTRQRLQRDLGTHHLSIGADFIRSRFELLGGGNPDGNFTVQLSPAQLASLNSGAAGLALNAGEVLALNPAVVNYAVELRPQRFGTPQSLAALYLEDEWRIAPALTATLGLRWDYDTLTRIGPASGDTNNIAPRFSLNYRLDEHSVVRFGAGQFYSKLPYAVISDALQRNSTSAGLSAQLASLQSLGLLPSGVTPASVQFEGNLTVSPPCATVASCPAPAAVQALRDSATLNEARILNPQGYDSPYSRQFTLGYQRELGDTMTVGADLIYNRSYNLVRLRDLNAPAPFTPDLSQLTPANIARLQALPDNAARLQLASSLGLVRLPAVADASRPVALVPGGARQITVSDTSGRSTYRALNLHLEKLRAGGQFAYSASYTLSRLRNDTDDINFRASDANNFGADWGPSANDRRHVFSGVAYWFPLPGLSLSLAGLLQSGQPVNLVPDARIFGTQDLNGDGQSFGEAFVGNSDRYPGVTRNSARLPWSTTFDMGMRYAVPSFHGRLEFTVDVFNVLNTNNDSGFANAATTSNQVQFGGGADFVQRNAAAPRQFQLGASWKR